VELSVKKVPPEREIESGKKGQKKERKRSLSALSQKRADSCDEGNDGALSLSLECYSAAGCCCCCCCGEEEEEEEEEEERKGLLL